MASEGAFIPGKATEPGGLPYGFDGYERRYKKFDSPPKAESMTRRLNSHRKKEFLGFRQGLFRDLSEINERTRGHRPWGAFAIPTVGVCGATKSTFAFPLSWLISLGRELGDAGYSTRIESDPDGAETYFVVDWSGPDGDAPTSEEKAK